MAKSDKQIKAPPVPEPPETASYYGGEKETEELEKEQAEKEKKTDTAGA